MDRKGNVDHLTIDESLRKGMRVIVTGRLVQRSFETREGERRTVVELQVDEVGPSGTFMCQGKMPLSVRKRYEKMREQNNISLNIDKLIANFDKALSHPNKVDLKTLEQIVILYEEK